MSSTKRPVNTDDMPVTAPALMFTAERENEPETGKAWVSAPTTFDRPCPSSSWFGSIFCLVRAAMALAMEIASMKPTSEMTMVAESRLPIISQEIFGRPNEGSPSGTRPTTSPPPTSLNSSLPARAMRQRRPSDCSPCGTLPSA